MNNSFYSPELIELEADKHQELLDALFYEDDEETEYPEYDDVPGSF